MHETVSSIFSPAETGQGSQNDDKRQFLLERLLDAVKQCQIRFGGRKEIASDSDSRVTCLCAQFEAVLQHGMKRSRGLALTAAAIKQAAGFASKTETEPVFWFYVKEVLNKHELQRFYSLHHITADVGRGRAWLRCALNEHSLERYLHMLLADRARLSTFYEDWSFVMDEERSSMLPTMAAGLNSILFAINIDNKDLNGQSKFAPTVSDLLKESTQNVTSLLKESTQGMSSLLREITASSAVSILIKPEQETDPLPVISKNVNVDARCKRERRRRKKVTNIVSFDDDDDEPNIGDTLKKIPGTVESSSINIMSTFESPFGPNSNGSQSSNSWKLDSASLNGESGYQKLDVKSIDDDVDENEEDVYRNSAGRKHTGHSESPDKPLDGNVCLPQVHGWAPLQVLHGDADADTDVLFPVSGVGSYVAADAPVGSLENGTGPDDHVLPEPGLRYSMEASSPGRGSPLSSLLPSASMPESMTVHELRQAIVAMMNRKDELEEENGQNPPGCFSGVAYSRKGIFSKLPVNTAGLGELSGGGGPVALVLVFIRANKTTQDKSLMCVVDVGNDTVYIKQRLCFKGHGNSLLRAKCEWPVFVLGTRELGHLEQHTPLWKRSYELVWSQEERKPEVSVFAQSISGDIRQELDWYSQDYSMV
ncbi:sorting nexin-29-like protein [Cricetulus griseus]|nr:sorting nexin-29-like protein [Cricetulus griseus]